MPLSIISHFVTALRTNDRLMSMLRATAKTTVQHEHAERLFVVARTLQDETEDLLPYVIIEPLGVNAEGDKDQAEAGDTMTVGLLCVHHTFRALAILTGLIRSTLNEQLLDISGGVITDYSFSMESVKYDPDKPCYFTTLTYNLTLSD